MPDEDHLTQTYKKASLTAPSNPNIRFNLCLMIQYRGPFIYLPWVVTEYEQLALAVASMLAIFYLVSLFAALGSAVGPIIDLGYSKYEGTALGNGVSQWLGIRFAAPPLGSLRFRAPADPIHNETLQKAVEVSPH